MIQEDLSTMKSSRNRLRKFMVERSFESIKSMPGSCLGPSFPGAAGVLLLKETQHEVLLHCTRCLRFLAGEDRRWLMASMDQN